MSVTEIQQLNGLTDNTIAVGQVLRVSKSNTETQQTKSDAIKHVVKAGETLFSISKKYGVSIKQIQDLNQLNGNSIPL
jgi:N-acetylmuramoyl-L-alanine amidase